jgi:hypothetical protein
MRRTTAIFSEFQSQISENPFSPFQPWFRAAAIYNLVWGGITLLFPQMYFRLFGMAAPNYPVLWQVVGMFVLVYAPGYWWAAHDPFRFRHLIFIGCLGKICGPLGFLWFAGTGALPLVFGWTILTNDIVWLPAFLRFLARAAERTGGWTELARGA